MSVITTITSPTPNMAAVNGFFTDDGFDFLTRMAIGYAAQGVFDVGQVSATVARVSDGDADSWYRAWRQTAEKLHTRATAGLVAGHTETAHRLFLAAAESYAQAIAFADGMTDSSLFGPTFALHRQCWEAFVDSSAGRIERISVPYESTTLPGYLFRPDTSGTARPTVVLTNGSEGSISGLWAYGAGTALARGWNAFLYDGPGQQTMLFDHNIPFRHDWEAVLTPVVDSLVERPDVEASALFAYGVSQAGYWVPRALAYEHRFAAAVADPGVMDVSTAWLGNLPAELIAILQAGNKEFFNGAMAEVAAEPKVAEAMAARGRPFAKETPYDTFQAVMQYNLRDIVGTIQTPMMITNPDDEAFWPGQSTDLVDHLTGHREIVHFLREDGANVHCEPLGRAEAEFRMFDFFQDHLTPKR